MPPARGSALLGLVDSDDDGDIIGGGSNAQNKQAKMPPAKRGRPAGAARGGMRGGGAGRSASVVAGSTRKPLLDKAHNAAGADDASRGRKRAATEELANGPKSKAARGGKSGQAVRGRKAAQAEVQQEEEEEVEEEEPYEDEVSQPKRRGRPPKARATTPPTDFEVPGAYHSDEEQPDHMEFSIDDIETEEEEPAEEAPAPRAGTKRASSVRPTPARVPMSATKKTASVPNHRTGGGDADLRRRLGEMTRKYETLEAKYQALREVGVKEAERHYDQLKQQSEEKAKGTTELIAQLKAQVATKTEVTRESQALREQIEANETTIEQLQEENSNLTTSLENSKKEVKTLTTRLTQARAAEAAAVKVPGSAMKGTGPADKRVLANAEATVQAAQKKEELYGDLTGFAVLNVKREEDEFVFDCIQEGRNGTLHFKLAIGSDDDQQTQWVYMPQLDENRDQELIELLPDYLTDDISFPRLQAAKFYSRVMKALTERLD